MPVRLEILMVVRIQSSGGSCSFPCESVPQPCPAGKCSSCLYRQKTLEAPSSKVLWTFQIFIITKYQLLVLFLFTSTCHQHDGQSMYYLTTPRSMVLPLQKLMLSYICFQCLIQALQVGSLLDNPVFLASLEFSRSLRSIRVEPMGRG